MICTACGRGFHKECSNKKGCKKCHPKDVEKLVITGKTGENYKKRGKTAKDLKDALSTGRKRAAELYPLNKDQPCEWRGLKNCGGGKRPVMGCVDGKQVARHHGPVKDTTRNHEGNVHRICTGCHNHWHELNDLIYDQQAFGLLPHDPDTATVEELVQYQLDWMSGKMKEKYELASSVNKKFKAED
jgi:hypothetical protein